MMTLSEFHYKRYAQEYKEVDEMRNLHLSAFLNRSVTATKNVGTEKKPKEEYVYPSFNDFFNYEEALEQVDKGFVQKQDKPINKQLSLADIAMKRNKK